MSPRNCLMLAGLLASTSAISLTGCASAPLSGDPTASSGDAIATSATSSTPTTPTTNPPTGPAGYSLGTLRPESLPGVTGAALALEVSRVQRSLSEADPSVVRRVRREVSGNRVTVRDVIGEGDDTPGANPLAANAPKLGDELSLIKGSGAAAEAIHLTSVVDFKDKVRTDFVPFMVVIPADLTVGLGRSVISEFEMIVHPLKDPTSVQTRGRAKNEVTVEGVQRVRGPLGEHDAVRIRSVLTASLGVAKVKNESLTWYAPGVGVVLAKERTGVTALGLPVRSDEVTWVTVQSDGAPGKAAKPKK
ncbi:MAG: hypothetical protein K2X32_11975 [Phycisphaerales bacterium]|nr:hypothetical protein [Phycisphaerales bacterium]